MAEQPSTLDVWIIETNTVYKAVPYTVVADWAQQGRLLENDRLRPAGTTEWQALGSMPAFNPYLPRAQPHRAEDQAEALEPVHTEIVWKPRAGDEDEDVDMIPLIDVSLVLLIFFMMTATVTGVAAWIQTPTAHYPPGVLPNAFWIGIDRAADGTPLYAVGKGDQNPQAGDRNLSQAEAIRRLEQQLREAGGAAPNDVTVKADMSLPYEVIERVNIDLERLRAQGLIRQIFAGVRERQQTP
jgi:biopolymer transport protein ExbD